MGARQKMDEVAPFVVMVTMEGCTIALTILAKTAITRGLSPFVFVLYTNAIGSLFLFLFHQQRTEQSVFTFPFLVRVFLMGLTGIAMYQNLAFLGLSYSSPIVVCSMGLLIPSISFLLSILLRRTRLDLRSSSTQIKVMGTLISIIGAVVVELYKGPFIRKSSFLYTQLQLRAIPIAIPQLFVFYKAPDNWILGGILLAAATLSVSIWNIIQLGTLKQYPQVMKVASFYSLAGTIQCLVFSLFIERDMNAWKLKLNLDLLLIVVTGIFGSIIRSNVHLACTRMKGPLYVPLFKPFGIVFATFFGVTFFTNSLHYGSVIGTTIIGAGYYAVMWGQIREEELGKEHDIEKMENASDTEQIKTPLLQDFQEEAQV